MFSFFERKIFLVDHLRGLVDIHNHILPGIDDGAKTVEESVSLIKGFSEFGVKNFICTPHIMHHYYPNTRKTIKNSFEVLEKELIRLEMDDVKIDYAAEHMIDENFEDLLESNSVLPLAKEYLLVEMSYLQPSLNFKEAVRKIAEKSFFIILAHPERYAYFHERYSTYTDLKSSGIKFQINLLSLAGYYGPEIFKITLKLIENGLVEYVSSDAHNLKHLRALKETKISKGLLEKVLPIIDNTLMTFY